MSGRMQRVVLLLFAAVLLRLGMSDVLLHLVRPGTRPLVLAAGDLLAVLALLPGGREGGTRLAWLALLPIAAVLVVGTPSLGAYTAARQVAAVPRAPGHPFGPLAGSSVSVVEFALRSLDRHGATLARHPVELTGFVVRQTATGFVLARLVITCCAADAEAVEVDVRSPARPPVNGWVTVAGSYRGSRPDGVPVLGSTSVVGAAQPADPYDR